MYRVREVAVMVAVEVFVALMGGNNILVNTIFHPVSA